MKKHSSILLTLLVTLFLSFSPKAQADMPVKAKAFLTIVGYGAGGGAILGAASMAFGGSTRAIAQGASLGLYAGIIFGTYVLVSHHNKRYGNYDDNSSPYKDSSDIYGDDYQEGSGGGSDGQSDNSGSFFNRMDALNHKMAQKTGGIPPISMNLLQLQF
jgi:hypothetical protein